MLQACILFSRHFRPKCFCFCLVRIKMPLLISSHSPLGKESCNCSFQGICSRALQSCNCNLWLVTSCQTIVHGCHAFDKSSGETLTATRKDRYRILRWFFLLWGWGNLRFTAQITGFPQNVINPQGGKSTDFSAGKCHLLYFVVVPESLRVRVRRMSTFFAQTFRTPSGVQDIPTKFLGHCSEKSSCP